MKICTALRREHDFERRLMKGGGRFVQAVAAPAEYGDPIGTLLIAKL